MSEKLLVPAELYDEALAFCNARRVDVGLEPVGELLAGFSNKPFSCPCANAVPGLAVGNTNWWSPAGDIHTRSHPTRFVAFFDAHAKLGVLTLPVRDDGAEQVIGVGQ